MNTKHVLGEGNWGDDEEEQRGSAESSVRCDFYMCHLPER